MVRYNFSHNLGQSTHQWVDRRRWLCISLYNDGARHWYQFFHQFIFFTQIAGFKSSQGLWQLPVQQACLHLWSSWVDFWKAFLLDWFQLDWERLVTANEVIKRIWWHPLREFTLWVFLLSYNWSYMHNSLESDLKGLAAIERQAKERRWKGDSWL